MSANREQLRSLKERDAAQNVSFVYNSLFFTWGIPKGLVF